ncbi:MAG: membrane protein insertase YidC [Propionibacteriaceae bacterium]|jgi:YidC/Oxa1 family membrane protein insertase|nr:membrane protein insertase YidC [Propionibacteriaceae bacterium]
MIPLDLWGDLGGFFNTLMQPIYWVISGVLVGFHHMLATILGKDSGWTWALSIVLLTMLTRACLIPLFVKQINSMRGMQLLGPKLKELQDKYKDDREKLGQETMNLYQQEGINPMASCLPILCQSPVFIGLYWVLYGAINNQPTGWWMQQDASLVPSLKNATIFGAPISSRFAAIFSDHAWTAVQTVTVVMIVIMCFSLFWQQFHLSRKNMPPSALEGPMAQQQKIMIFVFPLMYAFMGTNIPLGVLIYWMTTNLWTLCQQTILIRNNPTPGTPAFLDWEERMRKQGKDPDEILKRRQDKLDAKRKKKVAKKTAAGKLPPQAEPKKPTGPVGPSGKPVVQRQQHKKQTRAQRKKS